MRLFLALELPADTARAIVLWRDRNPPGCGREVPPANLHLTLAFLGEIRERDLEALCDAVDAVLMEAPATRLALPLDRVGYWAKPGIFWLGSSQAPAPELRDLADALRRLPGRFGNRIDRHDWIPHITLYRGVNSPPAAPLGNPQFLLRQDRLTLFQSRVGRNGVHYEAIADWPLHPAPGR